MRALPAPEPTRRITTHAHSAPLHKIRTDDMLPLQLLTPTQARARMHKKLQRWALSTRMCSTAALLHCCTAALLHSIL